MEEITGNNKIIYDCIYRHISHVISINFGKPIFYYIWLSKWIKMDDNYIKLSCRWLVDNGYLISDIVGEYLIFMLPESEFEKIKNKQNKKL